MFQAKCKQHSFCGHKYWRNSNFHLMIVLDGKLRDWQVITIHDEGGYECTKLYTNPSNSWGDISLKHRNVSLVAALEETLGNHQNRGVGTINVCANLFSRLDVKIFDWFSGNIDLLVALNEKSGNLVSMIHPIGTMDNVCLILKIYYFTKDFIAYFVC